jgi:hypothetical protein
MLTTVSSTDLAYACQILFSTDETRVLAFVKTLDLSTLKTAFRKKALETHPDRAKALGRAESDQSQRFREVKKAYELLLPVAGRKSSFSRVTCGRQAPSPGVRPRPARPRKSTTRTSYYFRGPVPSQPMRLGQFLYYSGIITWRHLIDAISWQRRIKPRYGQIALDWEIIDLGQITQILRAKTQGERFGEYARKNGIISEFQHLAIMGKQQKFHRLFGEYFLDHGILTPRQLDIVLKRLIQHNMTHG